MRQLLSLALVVVPPFNEDKQMAREEVIEIVGAAEIAKDIEQRVRNVGVKGLSLDVAKECGVFERISNLLSATHSTILAAYIIYGWVEYMLSDLGAERNIIAKEMHRFNKDVKRYIAFWTEYYANQREDTNEVGFQAERLANQIMSWMELPQQWKVGDAQRINSDASSAIRFKVGENVYTLRVSRMDVEREVVDESYAVLEFDPETNKQESIHTNMDKASAMMVAKRLSDENKDKVYNVALVQDIKETRTDVTPIKAFQANNTIGSITKTFNE